MIYSIVTKIANKTIKRNCYNTLIYNVLSKKNSHISGKTGIIYLFFRDSPFSVAVCSASVFRYRREGDYGHYGKTSSSLLFWPKSPPSYVG